MTVGDFIQGDENNDPDAPLCSSQDYYAFGMVMPSRSYTFRGNSSLNKYRFGFNGMENVDEVKGNGNSLDFGARIYDSRTGRWLSLDPLQAKYPDLSPYNFVANSPIVQIDPDGKRNTIYLLNYDPTVTMEQKIAIQKHANNYLTQMGLNTRVEIVKKGTILHYPKMDKTDAVAILGNVSDIQKAVSVFNKDASEILEREIDPVGKKGNNDIPFGKGAYFETTPQYDLTVAPGGGYLNTGNIIAIDKESAIVFGAKANYSLEETVALGIVHGLGHTAGAPHATELVGIETKFESIPGSENIMQNGNYFINKKVPIANYTNHPDSKGADSTVRQLIENKYGTESSKPASGIQVE